MEPGIDDGLDSELHLRFKCEDIVAKGARVDGYQFNAGTPRYVPLFWARVCDELRPKRPSSEELEYVQDVKPRDVLVFPELKGRTHVRLNLCEDGEVYELPPTVNELEYLSNKVETMTELLHKAHEALKCCHAALLHHPMGDCRAENDITLTKDVLTEMEATLK